jgi:hypothetical protein
LTCNDDPSPKIWPLFSAEIGVRLPVQNWTLRLLDADWGSTPRWVKKGRFVLQGSWDSQRSLRFQSSMFCPPRRCYSSPITKFRLHPDVCTFNNLPRLLINSVKMNQRSKLT